MRHVTSWPARRSKRGHGHGDAAQHPAPDRRKVFDGMPAIYISRTLARNRSACPTLLLVFSTATSTLHGAVGRNLMRWPPALKNIGARLPAGRKSNDKNSKSGDWRSGSAPCATSTAAMPPARSATRNAAACMRNSSPASERKESATIAANVNPSPVNTLYSRAWVQWLRIAHARHWPG